MSEFNFDEREPLIRNRRRSVRASGNPLFSVAAWCMIGLFVLAIAGGGYWWYQRIELDTMDQRRIDELWMELDACFSSVNKSMAKLEIEHEKLKKLTSAHDFNVKMDAMGEMARIVDEMETLARHQESEIARVNREVDKILIRHPAWPKRGPNPAKRR